MNPTDLVDQLSLRDDVPEFREGDTVRVHVKVVEGNRARVQLFEGLVIGRSGGGVRETFRVRKLSFGVGVERTFPVHSPIIAKIERISRGDTRPLTWSASPPRSATSRWSRQRSTRCTLPPLQATTFPSQRA